MCGRHAKSDLSRRHLMMGAGALLAAGALPARPARADDDKKAPNAIPPSEAFERLKQGNARYLAGESKERDYAADRAARAQGQAPIAAVIACSDSRVPPEIIFGQGPGDLFIVRDAGNVVTNYGIASTEFAVKMLGTPLILVLGHSGCGAVLAALQASTGRQKLPGHLPDLVKLIEPAVITAHGRHPGDLLAVSIEENVRLGMKRLTQLSAIIGSAVSAGKVAIKGGVYDIATGKVSMV